MISADRTKLIHHTTKIWTRKGEWEKNSQPDVENYPHRGGVGE